MHDIITTVMLAVFLLWLLNKVFSVNNLYLISLILLTVSIIPVYQQLTIVEILRGVLGNLSVTTFILLLYDIIKFLLLRLPSKSCYYKQSKAISPCVIKTNTTYSPIDDLSDYFKFKFQTTAPRWQFIILVMIGLCLYISFCGFITTDFYAWGYKNNLLIMAIITPLLIIYIWQMQILAIIIIIVGILTFFYQLLPSNNLWDYLYDPMLWIYAIYRCLKFS